MLSDRRRFIKRHARRLYGAYFAKCVIISMFLMISAKGIETFCCSVFVLLRSYLFEQCSYALIFFIAAAFFLMFSPLIFGVAVYFGQASENRSVSISKILEYYTSAQMLFRAIRITTVIALAVGVVVTVPVILKAAADGIVKSYLGMDSDGYVITAVFNILVLAISVAVAIWSSGFLCLFRLASNNPNMPVRTAIHSGFRCMRGHKTEFLLLCISFVPLVVLTYFTFGILFVPFLYPYIAFSASSFVSYVMAENSMPVFYGF